MPFSQLAETLIGSEIVRLGAEIKEKIKQGSHIFNFTIGDFDPSIFPIPAALEQGIIDAYRQHHTNYPAAEGNLDLREQLVTFIQQKQGLSYNTNEILIASGGRPLIYTLFKAVCDKGDKIIYAAPSWNNHHYAHFVEGQHILIETTADTNFMLTADMIRPHIQEASLLSLCSPQNPTGTTFKKEELAAICELVLEENKRRGPEQKKLYVMYDQMYWHLTYGSIQHHDPVSIYPAMKEYTVFIDAISKVFAATGVRVGWSMGPAGLIQKMKMILTHVGAWAPMAEQKALTGFLANTAAIDTYLSGFKSEIEKRLRSIHNGFQKMKEAGLGVDSIAPEAAIYLTVRIDLIGKRTAENTILDSQSAVTSYLLDQACLALVPFYAFGTRTDSPWYRLSVGTCKEEEIPVFLDKLQQAIEKLQ
ncbi:MAG: aminotransferase class I/II-fold pyridoxal phosphate-dependent enzyme [Bacteroidetes bacterium]|nr:aminotransferase class I/II-fold pyridoxal phosphate-dependent enzyme [Bacteroidota bacterium]